MSLRVLVIDDEHLVGLTIREFLESVGYIVFRAGTAQEGLDSLERDQPDVVLLDLKLPDAEGLDLIPAFAQHPTHPTSVIIITAQKSAETAVHALKRGAWDYLVKPVILDELLERLRRLERFMGLRREAGRDQSRPDLNELNPTQPQLRAAIRLAKEAARTDQPVCIVGELGTGRQRLAQLIHNASDRRADSCLSWTASEDRSRLQEQLASLVGAEPGATHPGGSRIRGQLELTGAGTLILREVQALSPAMQQVLTKLMNHRTYTSLGGQVRSFPGRLILTATPNFEGGPHAEPISQELRQMLLGRHIFLPPLRDRQQDFMPLLTEIIAELNQEYGRAVKGIEPAAVASLINHSWPGNVGELKLVLGRLWPQIDEARITRKHLPPEFQHRAGGRPQLSEQLPTLAEVERQHISRVMDLCQGNQTQAARILDIARSTLINKLKLYGEVETSIGQEN